MKSIDYVLDTIKKMKDYPFKYVSEEYERFIKKSDYKNLILMYKEFYPEIFNFKNIDLRLEFYSLKYDLELLKKIPESLELKKKILECVK